MTKPPNVSYNLKTLSLGFWVLFCKHWQGLWLFLLDLESGLPNYVLDLFIFFKDFSYFLYVWNNQDLNIRGKFLHILWAFNRLSVCDFQKSVPNLIVFLKVQQDSSTERTLPSH